MSRFILIQWPTLTAVCRNSGTGESSTALTPWKENSLGEFHFLCGPKGQNNIKLQRLNGVLILIPCMQDGVAEIIPWAE
jgi:hypothetical protein